jgi:hypothetical protein
MVDWCGAVILFAQNNQSKILIEQTSLTSRLSKYPRYATFDASCYWQTTITKLIFIDPDK